MATLLLACLLSAYAISFIVFGFIGSSDSSTTALVPALIGPFIAWPITIGIAVVSFLILRAIQEHKKVFSKGKKLAVISLRINTGVIFVSIILIILGLLFFMGPSKDDKCKIQLGELATYSNGKCDCDYGSTLINQKCVSLDAACKAKAGPHAVADNLNGNCNCEQGFALDQGQCVDGDMMCKESFGTGSIVSSTDASKCYCDMLRGYIWDDLEKKTKCVCDDTHIEINGVCVLAPTCGLGGHFNKVQKKCMCNIGYKQYKGQCVSNYDYCSYVYGNEAITNTENSCECLYGVQCKCSPDKDPTDQTPCVN